MKRSLVLILVLISLAACGAETTAEPSAVPDSAAPIAQTPEANGLLAEVRWNGGLCVDTDTGRVCDTILLIDSSGAYTVTGNVPEMKTGTIGADQLATIKDGLATTDFATVLNTPFEGTCPRAYDGSAPTYTFYTTGRDIQIDSCEVAVDAQAPLFSTIDTIYQDAWQ